MNNVFKNIYVMLLCSTLSLISGTTYAQAQELKENASKYATTLQLVNLFYTDSVDSQHLTEVAIKSLLEELDPHSVYMDPQETKEANEPLAGNFEGIGVQYQMLEDTITVISPVSGGPSEKVGIMPGDKIVEIDGENATGKSITTSWVQKRLRGPKDSEVTVKVVRSGINELLDFTIVRDVIPLYSVDAHYMVNEEIGYIKLSKFARTSVDEFDAALQALQEQGMTKLIFDLRNNSGGYLDVAISLSDEFLSNDKLIVYTEGRSYPKQVAKATEEGDFENGDIVVLINEGSASASEIVSGAIQDWDRGKIVGRRSFGKGLVQRPFKLADSSEIRLTVARYFTPSGRCIQKPYDNGNEDYFNDLANRLKHGELDNADSISFPDSLKYYTSSGRVVYGGGGIMPDVFVPLDTTDMSDYYKKLNIKAVAAKFAMQYVNDNRNKLTKKYKSSDKFIEDFTLTDEILSQFFEYANEQGVEYDEEGYNTSKSIIDTQLKAFIGRDLFDIAIFYRIINPLSDEFNVAIDLLTE